MWEKIKKVIGQSWFWVGSIIAFIGGYVYYILQKNAALQRKVDLVEHRKDVEKYYAKQEQASKEAADAVNDYESKRAEYLGKRGDKT